MLRQWQETIYLLQDTAARHMRTEEACDGTFDCDSRGACAENWYRVVHTGLIILDARYGLSGNGEGTEGLDVDVTIPMQALVNSSQIYIPGKRSKVRLHSFEFQRSVLARASAR